MELELRNLKIDRTARREKQGKPITNMIAVAVIVALAAIGLVFLVKKLNAAIPVQVTQVQSPMSVSAAGGQTILSATGYIIAAHKIEVASKVNGRVAWIGVDKGDKVKAGQVLVRLEDDEYRAQVTQQRGQLENLKGRALEIKNGNRPEEIEKARFDVNQAKADLENAKVSLDRTKQLSDSGVFSKQQLDDAQAKYDNAVAKVASLQRLLDLEVLGPRQEQTTQIAGQVEQARGALEYAQTQLDNTIIRAPISGTILDRNVEKGEFITTGFVGDKGAKGYIVTMADLNDLQVELDISQNDFPKLAGNPKAIITTDAYPDLTYDGLIEQVSPEADRAKATVQIKVRVLKPDDKLRPDMNATVRFISEEPKVVSGASVEPKQIVVIPTSAIQGDHVFVMLKEKAIKRSITTGGSSDKGTIVSSGLIGGEDLILNPPADLKDGQKVEAKQ
jgi:HlyD family secretion protein